MEGCERPNGAFRRGALRRRPWQQARRCGADPGLRRQTADLSGAATGAGAALRGVGAHRAQAPVIKGQNRVRTERRRSSVPRRRPRSVRTAPGRGACGPGCGLQEALCFPRRGPGGWRFQQRWMHLRPLCLKNGNWGGSPICPLRLELFLSLNCPTDPSGQCPSLHPSPPKLIPHPRVSRFFWALHAPRPAPSSILSPSPLSRF